ncbi:uncharacterized protein LOC131329989 [Rhododendron vialii]|uniref:uncharacterized protein LOC131329989 n=1 Tax=Rhododendron vialii TaxID=182163 RepID=UPI00265E2D3C|nr:uncharacterized protein LOC131329989 [Rhododendron vialii]
MLGACALDFSRNWEQHLPLVEFAYNNSYQTAQSRRKSYTDKRRQPLSFEVGDHAFLKIRSKKGVIRFGKKGKLSPCYIGPFDILEKIRKVAYHLALPPQLDRVHNVFHVSMLRKYLALLTHVLNWKDITLDEDVTYEEEQIEIQDRSEKIIQNKTIKLVLRVWGSSGIYIKQWSPLQRPSKGRFGGVSNPSAQVNGLPTTNQWSGRSSKQNGQNNSGKDHPVRKELA